MRNRRIYFIVSILILGSLVYFYYHPIYYAWKFSLDGIYSENGVSLQITKSDCMHLENKRIVSKGVIIDVTIDTERKDMSASGDMVFSEYKLPFLFTLSTTPIIHGIRKNDFGLCAYYDRIKKKAVFVINDRTIEITHRGKFLVYDGISIVIDQNSVLKIHIDKNGIMYVSPVTN